MEWRVAIVDDLKMDRERLQKDVAKWYAKQEADAQISVYDSGAAMLGEFSKDRFHIAFLDIRMKHALPVIAAGVVIAGVITAALSYGLPELIK